MKLKKIGLVYLNCKFKKDDLNIAKYYFSQALELNKDDKELYYYLGYIYSELKDDNTAIEYFLKAGDEKPVLLALATSQYNLNQYKKARKTLKNIESKKGFLDNKYYNLKIIISLEKLYQIIININFRIILFIYLYSFLYKFPQFSIVNTKYNFVHSSILLV